MNINQSMWSYFLEGNGDDDKVKLIYFGRNIYLSEFKDSVLRTASFLKSRGIQKGDVVSIMLPNTPEAVFALYATNAIGAIANFIDPRIGELALYKILQATKPKLIFILDMVFSKHKDIIEKQNIHAILCNIFSYAKGSYKIIEALLKVPKTPYFKDTLRNLPLSESIINDGCIPAIYLNSGGTTGEPKTAVFNSRAFNSISRGVIMAIHPEDTFNPLNDSMLMMLPIFHSFGLGVAVHGILPAFKAVILPRFSADKALKLIGKHKITHLAGIPYMYKKMMESKHFIRKNISSVDYLFCGGDRLLPDIKEHTNRRFKELGSKAEILEGYGLTETASVVSVNLKGINNILTQGPPLYNNVIKIADKKGREYPVGEIGEIHIKSDSLMIGYLNDNKTNAKVMYTDSNGVRWLKTSDLGKVDENGYLYFSERENRTVKIAANMVFPSAIEAVVNSLDEVSNSCAARALDKDDKPFIKLIVVAAGSEYESLETINKIHEVIEKNLSKYEVPREINFVSSLKLTPLGKVDYKSYETNFI